MTMGLLGGKVTLFSGVGFPFLEFLRFGEYSVPGAIGNANAEFTVKFYTEQSDSDPAEAGKKPARTWVLKTDVSGKMHFTKDSFVSGDAFTIPVMARPSVFRSVP